MVLARRALAFGVDWVDRCAERGRLDLGESIDASFTWSMAPGIAREGGRARPRAAR